MTASRNLGGAALTERVVRCFDACESPRLRSVLQSLVAHLHAFADEVRLTEQEWLAAIEFLTRTGRISTTSARSSCSCRTSSASRCSSSA